jgi:hypothetical protein
MENINYKYIDNIYHQLIKKHTVNIKVIGKESIKIDISCDSHISALKFILSQLFPNFNNIQLYRLINLEKTYLSNNMIIKEIEHEKVIYMSYSNNSYIK